MPSRHIRTADDCLRSAGAELIRAANMAGGISISEWRSGDALLEYQAFTENVLSISLSGGRQCCHVRDGKPARHGFDGAICLFPAGSAVSRWVISAPLHLLHIDFDRSRLPDHTQASPGNITSNRTFREVFQDYCPIISSAAQSIAHADWSDPALSPGIDALLGWILLNAVRIYSTTGLEARDSRGCFSTDQSQRIVDYLRANATHAIRLDELARRFHLSRYHFLRKFKNTFGLPPHAYLTGVRMERAHELLRTDVAKVSAVALECGYSHHSQFASAFKRHFGYTPSEMKRRE